MPLSAQPYVIAIQDVDEFLVDIPEVSLAEARFVPAGDDLLIMTLEGKSVLIEGYYLLERPPALRDHANTVITQAVTASANTQFKEAFQDDSLDTLPDFEALLPDRSVASAPLDNDFAEAFDIPLTLNIRAGDIAVLNDHVLPVPCADQAPEALTYTFLQQGRIGLLTADNKVLKTGDTFTHQDLLSGRVIYYHDESHGPLDTLGLKLTDAKGEVYDDIVITVQVLPEKAQPARVSA